MDSDVSLQVSDPYNNFTFLLNIIIKHVFDFFLRVGSVLKYGHRKVYYTPDPFCASVSISFSVMLYGTLSCCDVVFIEINNIIECNFIKSFFPKIVT